MKKFKVGVIGVGDISRAYLNNLKKYSDVVELYACATRSLEKSRRKAEEYGFKKPYGSGEELIADPEVDIVLNLTTPDVHYYYNLEALKAGKHVYSEKPLAATFAQGQEIMTLAKEKTSMSAVPRTRLWEADCRSTGVFWITGRSEMSSAVWPVWCAADGNGSIPIRDSIISRGQDRCLIWDRII